MYASVGGKFGMECRGHHSSLTDGYWIAALGRDYFDSGTDAFYLGSANENHLERIISESAFADGTVDLAAVGVAADADVERA
jgi:hypothetical protein